MLTCLKVITRLHPRIGTARHVFPYCQNIQLELRGYPNNKVYGEKSAKTLVTYNLLLVMRNGDECGFLVVD